MQNRIYKNTIIFTTILLIIMIEIKFGFLKKPDFIKKEKNNIEKLKEEQDKLAMFIYKQNILFK